MSTKEEFLKQKINNFIIFIEQKIGKDNSIYTEFQKCSKDLNLFLQTFTQLSTYATNGKFDPETILKFLEIQKVDSKKIKPEDFIKLNRYFNMFLKIIE